MPGTESRKGRSALLAFGRRVSADDAFEPLVAARGWRMENWQPTFMDASDRESYWREHRTASSGHEESGWQSKQVLRLPRLDLDCKPALGREAEPRLMVAAADDLPSLYFVGWHYIDFVLSCVGSNVSEAARVLGVRRSTLQRKRKKTPPDR